MEGGGGSSIISFGENSNGICASMMMPPLTSHPYPHAVSSNTLFLPLPLPSNQDLNRHNGGGGGSSMMIEENYNSTSTGFYLLESNSNNDGESCVVKAKIMAHPHYHRLLAAYVNCQKIGAPPEVVARLEEACASAAAMGSQSSSLGEDPALDQFMEAYCEMLIKYEQELSKPFKEAMLSLSRIESQFKALSLSSDTGDEISLNLSFSLHPSMADIYIYIYICSQISQFLNFVSFIWYVRPVCAGFQDGDLIYCSMNLFADAFPPLSFSFFLFNFLLPLGFFLLFL